MFLTVVDDFTRTTWLYVLKTKDQCVPILNGLFSYIETQLNAHVKQVHTDNAKELYEGPMLQLYLTKGIHHQRSCTQRPQQNSVVERKHKHLIETAWALSFHSNLPISFWGDAV